MRTSAALLFVILCAGTAAAEQPKTVRIDLSDTGGFPTGTATLTEEKGGVRIEVKVAGLQPGKHGIHIHNKGICDPPDFVTAGDHFNPFKKKHGSRNPAGKHAGDLPNLDVRDDGNGEGSFLAHGVTLGKGKGSISGGDGTSLVIHRNMDDEKTDPAGAAGGRIACGIIFPGK